MRKNVCGGFQTLAVIDVGGIPHSLLIQRAEAEKIKCTDWALEIFRKTSHLKHRFRVEIVAISLRVDLPKDRKVKTLRPLFTEAFQNGLCLCPTAVGIEILMQTKFGFVGEAFLAMVPVSCSCPESGKKHVQDNTLAILDKKSRYSKLRILSGSPASIDEFADGGMTYLFCRQIPPLVKAGFAKLP